jgi:hypothetical protein
LKLRMLRASMISVFDPENLVIRWWIARNYFLSNFWYSLMWNRRLDIENYCSSGRSVFQLTSSWSSQISNRQYNSP